MITAVDDADLARLSVMPAKLNLLVTWLDNNDRKTGQSGSDVQDDLRWLAKIIAKLISKEATWPTPPVTSA